MARMLATAVVCAALGVACTGGRLATPAERAPGADPAGGAGVDPAGSPGGQVRDERREPAGPGAGDERPGSPIPHASGGGAVNEGRDGETVDFPGRIRPILQSRCSPCHFKGGKMYERLPFDHEATVRRAGDRILTRIKDPDEHALISAFLLQGPAPEGTEPPAAPPGGPAERLR